MSGSVGRATARKASGRFWTGALLAGLATYLLLTLISGYSVPGLQYEEALFQHGAVHLLRSPEHPHFVTGEGFWIPIGGRHFPLMAIEYAGAAKAYLLLLPYSVAGFEPVVSRAVSAAATAFGLLGLGFLVQRQTSAAAGAAVVFLLAINPSFIAFSLYDSTGMTLWFASFWPRRNVHQSLYRSTVREERLCSRCGTRLWSVGAREFPMGDPLSGSRTLDCCPAETRVELATSPRAGSSTIPTSRTGFPLSGKEGYSS